MHMHLACGIPPHCPVAAQRVRSLLPHLLVLAQATWRGQLFGSLVILCGIIFLAMPLSIVGNNFASTFEVLAPRLTLTEPHH